MASVEQPLKKRKLYEPSQPPPPPPSQPPPPPPPPPPPHSHDDCTPPPPQTPPPLSPEEIIRRRRTQEEIRNVYESLRTIKRCISSGKDAQHLPELEQAYLFLISASRGCASVQRILSEFIPRYASYCPTALEAAAQVVINMHNWNVPLMNRGEDMDEVSFETAKNCIAGLVDICCTASREAPSSSVIQGICSVVFINAATFFANSVESKSTFEILDKESLKMQDSAVTFVQLKQLVLEENVSPFIKLMKFRALCLLRILFLCPRNLLGTCFELFSNHAADGICREGKYFLSQLCCTLTPDVEAQLCYLFGDTERLEARTDNMRLEKNDVNYGRPGSDHDSSHKKKEGSVGRCLLGVVIGRDPSLKQWLFSLYRRLQNSASSEAVSEVTSAFQGIVELFGKLDTRDTDDDNLDSSRYVSRQSLVHGMPNKQRLFRETSGRDASVQLHDKPFRDDSCSKSSGPYLKRHSSIVSVDSDPHSTTSSNHDSGGSKSMDIDSKEDGDRCRGWLPLPNDQMRSPGLVPNSSQIKTDRFERRDQYAQCDVNQASNSNSWKSSTPMSLGGFSGSIPTTYHPATSNQIVWYSDGDAAAMDVFSASRQLWLGSFSRDASEASLRYELERFGPIENFMFFHVKGFALVEYKSIIDAIKAREFLQRYSPWGYSVRVKFMDVGLGTRGAVNSVAIGSSCHVFVGNVSNQWMKDEIVHETMKLVHRGPCLVTDLTSEGALLLEFENPEEAAIAMACIRQFRRGNNGLTATVAGSTDTSRPCPSFWSSVPTMASSNIGQICNPYLGSPHGQTAGSPSNRMYQPNVPSDFMSPRGNFEQVPTAESGRRVQSNVTATVCTDTAGPAPGTSAQMWQCQKPDLGRQFTGERPTCTSIATQGSTIALPQPAHYGEPFYPLPSSSWDVPGSSHHIPPSIVPPAAMSSNVHINLAPPPFVQASVPALSQVSGSDIHSYNQIPSQPMVQPPLSLPPQSQFELPPLPSSSPLVPPPPRFPPPPPSLTKPPSSSTESSSLVPSVGSTHIKWQGTLSKSGVHFCSIYAQRLDSDFCRYSLSVSEPAGWPVKLDMTKRTDYLHVKATFTSTLPNRREVCQLFPSSAADHKGFQDFILYLKQRDCAGVIKIPSKKPLWARLVFILPYSPEACSMLSVKPDATDCLLAVVLPKEATTECA